MQIAKPTALLIGVSLGALIGGCGSSESTASGGIGRAVATSVTAANGGSRASGTNAGIGGQTSPFAAGGITGSGASTTTGALPAGAGGAAASTSIVVGGGSAVQCGLPVAGAAGVAKPTGAPEKLTVVDWAGFKGAVTYTFDDGNSSQIEHYTELNALGVPFTFYLVSGKSSASDPIWAQALKDGHELGNHSKSHAEVGTAADVEAASTFIQQKYGVKAWTLAAPYGNASYVAIGETSFLVNRGVENAIVKPNDTSKPFNLPCFIPAEGDPASVFNTQVDQAVTAGGWRIILVHGFSGGTDRAYLPIKIEDFVESVKHTKSLGNVWIGTMVDVAAYWRGQAAVTKAVAAPAATGTTYTWTLPANFPPGKCLRVTAGGGTVSQGANAIPWNDHGYYEISLDAGTVTVSP